MAATTTAHQNAIDQLFVLAVGLNTWPALLAAQGPAGIGLAYHSFSFLVDSGGPVSSFMGKTPMSAITDGHQWTVDQGDTLDGGSRGATVDCSLLQFWATANGDKLRIRAF